MVHYVKVEEYFSQTANIRPVFRRHVLPESDTHTDGALTYAAIPSWEFTPSHQLITQRGVRTNRRRWPKNLFQVPTTWRGSFLACESFWKHSGFTYKRVFLALDEFLYYSDAVVALFSFVCDIRRYGTIDTDGADPDRISEDTLFYDSLKEWLRDCTCDADVQDDCQCLDLVIAEENASETK